MSQSTAKLLSILIPSYRYAEGVDRILGNICPVPDDVEVLIFDDSPESDVAAVAHRYQAVAPQIIYRHNKNALGKALGAATNWNALLDHASGQYVMLMHHDEMPASPSFLSRIRDCLNTRKAPDVLLLDLLLLDHDLSKMRRHVPVWLRNVILKHAPGYLFRRNVIGPTACLVMRREVAPRFDTQLVWLIDVDFYYRLISKKLHWVTTRQASVGSVQRESGSITASISGQVKALNVSERNYLAKFHVGARIWLASPFWAPVRWFEAIVWAVFRGFTFAIDRLAMR